MNSVYKVLIFFVLLGFWHLSFASESGAVSSATATEFVGEEAEPWVQEIGQWAQEAVGVPVERRTRIYKDREKDGYNILAAHNPISGRIYVYPDFYGCDWSVQKQILAHEGVHLKYHNAGIPTRGLIAMATEITGLGSFLLVGHLLEHSKYYNFLRMGSGFLSIMGAIYLKFSNTRDHNHFTEEHRADTEGMRALKCHRCALEVTIQLRSGDTLCENGYLSFSEAFDLAQEQRGLSCHEHEGRDIFELEAYLKKRRNQVPFLKEFWDKFKLRFL